MAELLLELFSEEIPARMQSRASEDLARRLGQALQGAGLMFDKVRCFATPRRLTVVIDGSNGMASKMVPAVFGGIERLDIVPLLMEITGSFVHDPNPLVEQNLTMLKEKMEIQ
jgi:hypothetical protein